jgi:hypothetical protein
MKKKLFLLGIFYFTCVCIFAQQQEENLHNKQQQAKGIKLSMNTGFLLSNMFGKGTVDDVSISTDYDNVKGYYGGRTNGSSGKYFLPGHTFGIGIVMCFNKMLALDIDINYKGKGCRIPVSSIDYGIYDEIGNYITKKIELTEFAKYRLHYLTVPVKIEICYKMFYVTSGIYTGFLLNAKESVNFPLNNFYVKFNDKKDRYGLIDFGVLLTLGICIPLSLNDFLKIGIGGEWSVIDIRKKGLLGVRYPIPPFYNQSYNLELKYERKIK